MHVHVKLSPPCTKKRKKNKREERKAAGSVVEPDSVAVPIDDKSVFFSIIFYSRVKK